MVLIYSPLSIWMQFGSLFFTLSGVQSDLLVIRFFLILAYLMLFLNAILGAPVWPNAHSFSSYGLFIDSLVWSLVGLYVHGVSFAQLLLDERPVDMDEDQEALWRLFYRTGGLSQRLFASIVAPHLTMVDFAPGDDIPTTDNFYIVYQGRVRLKVLESGLHTCKFDRVVRSGQMFDIKYLDLFSLETFFQRNDIECSALTHCRLFCFERSAMRSIAHHFLAKGMWQSLLINDLSVVAESYSDYVQAAERGEAAVLTEKDTDEVFAPLKPWELPDPVRAGSGSALKRPLLHLFTSMKQSFSLPWPLGRAPAGLRQTLLPAPPSRSAEASEDDKRIFRSRLERSFLFESAKSHAVSTPNGSFATAPRDMESGQLEH